MTTHVSYRLVQAFTVLWIALPAGAVVGAAGVAAARAPLTTPALAALVLLPALLLLLLGRLVIELRGDRLHWHFGYVGWPRWSVALDDIAHLQVARARAIQGAGIKGLGRRRLFNVTMGGPVLQFDLRDGRVIQLGTPEPERLLAFIDARRAPAD